MKQSTNTLSRTPVRARRDEHTSAPFSILVPLDGIDLADDIRPYVDSLAKAKAARIILLHVLPDLTNEPSSVIAKAISDAQAHLAGFAKILGTESSDIVVELRMGDAATEILRLSILSQASVIAMPTHGHSGLKRLVAGSVAEKVLRRSRCPMLLLHSCGQGGSGKMQLLKPFSRILVAIEGTAHGDLILPFVTELACEFHSELVLFHNRPGIDDTGEQVKTKSVEQILAGIKLQLERSGLKVSIAESHAGKTPDEIIQEAHKSNIDLIAMTTHGRRGLDRIAYGSITEEVLRNCIRPILAQCLSPPELPEADHEPAG